MGLMANKSHGINTNKVKPMWFHSMAEIPMVIEKVLIKNGITLHPSRVERKTRGGKAIRYKKEKI
jgi:hypothetical protein